MRITTKGRYALRMMIDVAENGNSTIKDVAERQGISRKFLEQIAQSLSKAGLLAGSRGHGGGYKLTRNPEDITALDVIEAVEGKIAVVSCLEDPDNQCERCGGCKTLPLWMGLKERVETYLRGVTIRDLMKSVPNPYSSKTM